MEICLLRVSADDANLLAGHNIRCSQDQGASDNVITLPEDNFSPRGLEISFGGSGNRVDFIGDLIPSGRVWCMKSSASALIDTCNNADFNFYLYENSEIVVKKCLAIWSERLGV